MRSRRAIQNKRKISDRDIASFFSGEVRFQEIDGFLLTRIANPLWKWYWDIIKLIL